MILQMRWGLSPLLCGTGQFEGLRESNHTSDNSDIDAYKDGHVENTSPDERVDTDASTETSVVLHANNKKFGNEPKHKHMHNQHWQAKGRPGAVGDDTGEDAQ